MTHYCKNGDIIRVGGVYEYHLNDKKFMHAVERINGEKTYGYEKGWSSNVYLRSKEITRELPRDIDGYYLWQGKECPVPGEWIIEAKGNSFWYIYPADAIDWDKVSRFRVISADEDVQEVEPVINSEHEQPEPEYTGGSVSYYRVSVRKPTTIAEPYDAECNDIIEALNMNYAEGNAFKAIWRRCAARNGKAKAGYKDGLYDAEKVVFFGRRMVEQEALERGE